MDINPLDLLQKSAKEMTNEELVTDINKIHWKIKEALDEDNKSMAYFFLGAVCSVTHELELRQQKPKSQAGENYYFYYDEGATEDYGYDGCHVVALVHKSFYDKNGYLEDRHIIFDLPAEVREALGREVMESFFEVIAPSRDAAIEILTNLGMTPMEE